ncbi:hypothetical protein HQ325_11725 [Rhodococcus sp. BP-349]|nr:MULTISPECIES: hypothetical protein [unclassified Rhodococcus (in: high G+C Gram-positive bacteria)]MBY6539342.1 hypothetical protein [Rhodococcus sp. BP-363]MBY6544330.1 hypothetical protein [Rhodococcus sp. BP-369]MBY6563560.1 hypothetical protein [Rhodococcus sp. BP-370]MBY6577852.1 hypothetical protein [Rhodococcus sp. BP-364]MBY6587153.1 hypothetical protein [Rhodococcus sp. BP-358]
MSDEPERDGEQRAAPLSFVQLFFDATVDTTSPGHGPDDGPGDTGTSPLR